MPSSVVGCSFLNVRDDVDVEWENNGGHMGEGDQAVVAIERTALVALGTLLSPGEFLQRFMRV